MDKKWFGLALSLCLVTLPLFAQTEDKIRDLESADDAKVVEAAQWLGKEKEKKAIDPLINVAKSKRSSWVRLHAISALGLIKEKGKTTSELRSLIEEENQKPLVYAALVAILNIKDVDNPDFKKALELVDERHQDDPDIKDITARIRRAIK